MRTIKHHFVLATALLFMLPFAGAVYLLTEEVSEDIEFSGKERVGLRYHGALYEILIAAQQYRGKLFVAESTGVEVPSGVDDNLQHALRYADTLRKDAISLGVVATWDDLRKRIEMALPRAPEETPEAHFERQTQALQGLNELMYTVGDTSNLILDPHLETYYMMNVIVNIVPSIVETMGDARGRVAGILGGGSITPGERQMLYAAAATMEDDVKRYHHSVGVIEQNDPENVSNKVEQDVQAAPAAEDLAEFFQAAAENDGVGTDYEHFFDRATAAIGRFTQAYRRFGEHLDWHLRERVHEEEAYLAQVLAFLGIGIVFSILVSYSARKTFIKHEVLKREQIRIKQEAAESVNVVKADFLANMSHELRTPLNSIIGMVELLKETGLANDQREMLETMNNASQNLLEIVNDVLDISKIESGGLELEYVPFDAQQCVGRAVDMLMPMASRKGLTLMLHVAEGAGYHVMGDPVRYTRIVTNLVSNAVKYTEKGAVDVYLASSERPDGKRELRLDVQDTGIGIAADKLGKIFDKFVQADSSTTRKYGGSGLGLAITQQLVKMMNGEVTVRSMPGQGSCFSVVLPMEPAQGNHVLTHAHEAVAAGSCGIIPASSLKVLVAEDHLLNQIYVRKLLPSLGITNITVVDNGIAAKEAAVQGSFDIVLMDCHMPGMNGYDATREIRKAEKPTGRHTIIVAMTANAMPGERQKCLACGMDEYVSKPIERKQLAKLLSQWVKFREQTEDSRHVMSDTSLLDMTILKTFSAEDITMEREFARTFYEQTMLHLERLAQCCIDGSSEEWKEATHLLKGGAATMGAASMQDLCAKAQEMLTSTGQQRQEMLGEIRKEFDLVCAELRRMQLLPEVA